jgi:hypothetical protein
MTQSKDLCPLNMTGDHRYFIFKTVEVFEPIPKEEIADPTPGRQLYEKIEYALLGCNCGSSIKTVVEMR